jgi:hypothetical protein
MTEQEKKKDVVKETLVVYGAIAGSALLTFTTGYLLGVRVTENKFGSGLKMLFLKDPTLETHMEEVLKATQELLGKK